MLATDRSVLMLGDEPPRVDRLVATLRRANLTIARAQHTSEADRMLRQSRFDLFVVALPVLGAERVLKNIRNEACVSRRAGVIVVGANDELEPGDLALSRHANRLLPGGCSTLEFQQEVATLLNVPPRVELVGSPPLQLTLPTGAQLELRLENLSTSGMLLRALEPLAVGTVFGFALELDEAKDPIRGRARVVRVAARNAAGEAGLGAKILALGGEGPQRIEARVEQARAAAAEAAPAPLRGAVAAVPGARGGRLAERADALDAREVESCRAELTDLTPVLDEILERGLTRRLIVADWYITGAELGLESIRAFSAILASIYESRRISAEAERRLADLVEVRSQLIEFGRPQQDVATRVRILLALRPALQRLLRELAETSTSAATSLTASRQPGVISQTVVEIRRLVGARRGLETLLALLEELGRTRLLPRRGAVRRSPEQIAKEFGPLAASLGIALSAAQLERRSSLRATVAQVEDEMRSLQRRLATVHQRAYSLRFRSLASGDVEADLQDPKLHQVLLDTMAAGTQYLARAYAAYRHALEVVGEETALIDRIERLGATVLAAERA